MSFRSLAKRAASPITRRVYFRIDNRVRSQVDPVRSELHALLAQLVEERAATDRVTTAVLNAMSTQNASARTARRLSEDVRNQIEQLAYRADYVENRVEFMRRELLLEARYGAVERGVGVAGAGSTGQDAAGLAAARIVRPDRVKEQGADIRLNLGAGHIPDPEYLNVDSRELDGIDIVADVRTLPFDDGTVAEIYSAHFLEHFPVEELRRAVLPRLVALLREGGRFVAVVPDMETMIAECAAGRMPYDEFFESAYGGQEYEGDFHFAGFTAASLSKLLEEAGLSDVDVVVTGRRNGLCYEMRLEAVRPPATDA
jgi:hypothetical protein